MTGRELHGARVLVTGAAGTLGQAICAGLARRGSVVVGLDLLVPAAGVQGCRTVVACDVTDASAVEKAVASAVDELGGLDVLVNCVGIGEPVDAGAMPGPETARMLEVNLLGPWRVTAAALPVLVEAGGHVVLVSSVLAYLAVPFGSGYAVSKRALCAWADALRVEYGPRLRVTTVYPGHIESPIHGKARALGLSMDGRAPFETPADVVRTVVDCLTSSRPISDRGTTPLSRAGLRMARYRPRIATRLTQASTVVVTEEGDLDGNAFAAGLAARTRARPARRGDGAARAFVLVARRLTMRNGRGN
jgi:NAD(P)-dependent dehydrogenase (short-subunit alcohol dehydrogenase family)